MINSRLLDNFLISYLSIFWISFVLEPSWAKTETGRPALTWEEKSLQAEYQPDDLGEGKEVQPKKARSQGFMLKKKRRGIIQSVNS